MKRSPVIIKVAAMTVSLLVGGCTATSPFTNKPECEDTINLELAAYKTRVTSVSDTITTDATAAKNGSNTAYAELESRKNFLIKLLTPASSNGSSQSSTGATAPIVASILGVLGIAIHADNRRKDSAINASKVVDRTKGI